MNGIDDILDVLGDINVLRWTLWRFAIGRGAFRTRVDNMMNVMFVFVLVVDD